MELAKLKLNPKNPQKFDDLSKLERSIKEFPKMMTLRPLVYDPSNMQILGGNKRLICLQNLEFKEIPDNWTKSADELTEDEKKRFILADNIGFGEWDWNVIETEFSEYDIEDWGLENDFEKTHNSQFSDYNYDDADHDNIEEIVGYDLSSVWILGRNEDNCLNEFLFPLPKQDNPQNEHYSRTNLDEITRVIKTYMRKGNFFLENCCGWSTFGFAAKYYGYSGIGVDIWDVALKMSIKQVNKVTGGDVIIEEMDSMNLNFNDGKFDFVYCNPPFMDSESYSKFDNDIANKDFESNIQNLMNENYRVLKKDSICIITIGDSRKNGNLLSNQNTIITSGIKAGFKLHDFVTARNYLSRALIMRKKAYEKRRTAKVHEFIIAFLKY